MKENIFTHLIEIDSYLNLYLNNWIKVARSFEN